MKKLLTLILLTALVFGGREALSGKGGDKDKTQRKATGVFDLQRNTVSEFDFLVNNAGIIGLDTKEGSAHGYWPRGSLNQYLFGGGFWFGAKKETPDGRMKKYVEVSYNPNSGRSWFVPGSIEDGDTIRPDLIEKNRVYFSSDFNQETGVPLDQTDGPNWPLWVTDTTGRYQYGTYIHKYVNDGTQRNLSNYPMGPLFVSDEDIYSVFKDTDLSQYEGGVQRRKNEGYPLGLEVESRIYTWKQGDMKDVVILSCLVHNKSEDTLKECWFAGIYDVDITYKPNGHVGATNDRIKYFNDDSTLNLAVGWSDATKGDSGRGLGYIGVSMLETPATDADGYIRTDKLIFDPSEQLGLVTFRNWKIENDVLEDEPRYTIISEGNLDGDKGPGDNRMLLATGPFNMEPGDVARVAVGISFAMPAKGGEADGTYEDLAGFKDRNKNEGSGILANDNSVIGKQEIAKRNYYQTILPSAVNQRYGYDLEVGEIYPNPVSNTFHLSYKVENEGEVSVSIIDQLGNKVKTLENEYKSAGEYNMIYSLDKNTFADGMYFVKLQIGNEIKTRKLVLMK